ncbi:hypothetical protein DUI87_25261 [Hirundo rustica rustica]|uniref:Uncharacterized protein n=1 Tax=Hirundo rustica rustica TaxID=333673 RepID=A0A3M0JBM6_HIRRU|nr:hypothetical protein DUI87_25261 [Hirundo rustica rustica]
MDTVLSGEGTCRYPLERSHLPELGEVGFAVMAEPLAEVVSFCDCLCNVPEYRGLVSRTSDGTAKILTQRYLGVFMIKWKEIENCWKSVKEDEDARQLEKRCEYQLVQDEITEQEYSKLLVQNKAVFTDIMTACFNLDTAGWGIRLQGEAKQEYFEYWGGIC